MRLFAFCTLLLLLPLTTQAQDVDTFPPDGIAVSVTCDNGDSALVVISPNAEDVVRLDVNEADSLTWLDDGGLAYQSENALAIVDQNGEERAQFALDSADSVQIAPDGTRFASLIDTVLTIMGINGDILAQLDGVLAYDWSPDFSQLAFVREDNIITILTDTTGATTPITGTFGQISALAWSPAGTQLAVIHQPDDSTLQNTLTVIDLVADSTRDISTDLRIHDTPKWSPDGTQLAFSASVVFVDNPGRDLYVVDANSDSPQNLTNFAGDEHSPSWSGDGERLAFVYRASEDNRDRLVVTGADGLGAYVLVTGTGQISAPAWRAFSANINAQVSDDVPEMLEFGVIAEVFVEDEALRLRDSAGLATTTVTGLAPGTQVEVIGGPQEADGYTWWNLRLDDGTQGWAVDAVGSLQTLIPIAYMNIARVPFTVVCEA